MSDKPKRVEAILFNGTLFREKEIVTIRTDGTYGRECTGRIAYIDILEFTLDMSEKYNHRSQKFEYDEVAYIKYADMQGVEDENSITK